VRIRELRVSLGWGLRLEAEDVEVWPAAGGAALQVERAQAELRLFAHLTGQRRLRRIRLEHPRMRIARDAAGAWSPPAADALFSAEAPGDPHEAAQPNELLRPLIALENLARSLLDSPLVADALEIRAGSVALLDDAGGAARRVSLAGIQVRLARRSFFGDTQLQLRARLRDPGGERGSFEWEGSQTRSGGLRVALAATELELEALLPWVREAHPQARLAGLLSGALVFESPRPGHGHLEFDLLARDVHSAPAHEPRALGPLEAQRAALSGTLAIAPERVQLLDARFRSDDLALELDGMLERPLHSGSTAELAVALRDVSVAEVRKLIGWLPEVRREEAHAILAPLEAGHIRVLRTGGTATLSGWQAFLAGRTRQLPRDFLLDATLDETTVRVGSSDRIESLSGRLWWTGDRIEVRDARAHLNGSPLPGLDLTVEGVSHLFASDPAARALTAGAQPLAGLRPLWLELRREPRGPEPVLTRLLLEIDRLDHPMFFWPIANASSRIEPLEDGVRIDLSKGLWAGVPVRGQADWLFEPREQVRARLTAAGANGDAPVPVGDGLWARGRFETGPVEAGAWRHERALGRFEAEGGEVRVSDAELELLPRGRVGGNGSLDLSRPDGVPFRLSFALENGDVAGCGQLIGLPPTLATGRLSAAGSFTGVLAPEASLASSLSGVLELDARDGSIRQAVPAVAALALASEIFNPFARREEVRFTRLTTLFELDAGRLTAEEFEIEGPDVRAFASGEIDIVGAPHAVDAEVALFLFRPMDSLIDKIPIVNVLLLGKNQNLMAAHFTLKGSWDDPEARVVPLRSITAGPGSLVFETLPDLLRRGIEAFGALIGADDIAGPEGLSEPANPAES
jgi:hypothetical protein